VGGWGSEVRRHLVGEQQREAGDEEVVGGHHRGGRARFHGVQLHLTCVGRWGQFWFI
jgi:hypothetical protein